MDVCMLSLFCSRVASLTYDIFSVQLFWKFECVQLLLGPTVQDATYMTRRSRVSPQAENTVINRDNAPRNRTSGVRTADDSKSRSAQPKERRKSKNKIPKSVRYDLETALVGLCDAWFEEIKPHLVRNNIKLHVHNTRAVPDSPSASGDFQQPRTDLPPCNHIDPGAAPDIPRHKGAYCVGSYSMQPTALEAHCFKHQASILRQNVTCAVNQSSPLLLPQNLREKSVIPSTREKCKPQRIPRICQTYVPATIAPIKEPNAKIKDIYIRTLFKSIFNKIPICPVSSPVALPKCNEQVVNVTSNTEPSKTQAHEQCRVHVKNKPFKLQDSHALFPNDLIDIIGKRNNSILRNISESNKKAGYPSVIELVSPKDRKTVGDAKKIPPWR